MIEFNGKLTYREQGDSWEKFNNLILNSGKKLTLLNNFKEVREQTTLEKMKVPNLPFYFVQKNNFSKMRRFAKIIKKNIFKIKEGQTGLK